MVLTWSIYKWYDLTKKWWECQIHCCHLIGQFSPNQHHHLTQQKSFSSSPLSSLSFPSPKEVFLEVILFGHHLNMFHWYLLIGTPPLTCGSNFMKTKMIWSWILRPDCKYIWRLMKCLNLTYSVAATETTLLLCTRLVNTAKMHFITSSLGLKIFCLYGPISL